MSVPPSPHDFSPNTRSELVQRWTHWLQKPGDSEAYAHNTILAYSSMVSRFLEYIAQIGAVTLDDVSPLIIRQYIREHLASAKMNTIKAFLGAIGNFYNWAVYEGLAQMNPMDTYREQQGRVGKRTPRAKTLPPVLWDDEVDALLYWVSRQERTKLRNIALVGLLLDTGLRVSEALSLTIQQGKTLLEHGKARVIGKGGKERVVRTLGYFREELQSWVKFLEEIPRSLDSPLFPGLNRNTVYVLIQRGLARAKTTKLQKGPHLLRHTAASRMLAAKWSSAEVRDVLGHASISTTEIYLHVLPS